jgi:hypothetical protein
MARQSTIHGRRSLLFQQFRYRFDSHALSNRTKPSVPSLFHVFAKFVQLFESSRFDALRLQIFFEDCDVAAELVDAT